MTGVSDSLHAVVRKRFVNPNPILTLPDLANAEDLGALDPFPLPTLNLGLPHPYLEYFVYKFFEPKDFGPLSRAWSHSTRPEGGGICQQPGHPPYVERSLDPTSMRRLVISTSPRIWVHSDTMLPTT